LARRPEEIMLSDEQRALPDARANVTNQADQMDSNTTLANALTSKDPTTLASDPATFAQYDYAIVLRAVFDKASKQPNPAQKTGRPKSLWTMALIR
jgi:hypothetical protein